MPHGGPSDKTDANCEGNILFALIFERFHSYRFKEHVESERTEAKLRKRKFLCCSFPNLNLLLQSRNFATIVT